MQGIDEPDALLWFVRAVQQYAERTSLEEARQNYGDIVVEIGGGTYSLTKPIVIDENCSGRNGNRVIFKAAEGETPVLSGMPERDRIREYLYGSHSSKQHQDRKSFLRCRHGVVHPVRRRAKRRRRHGAGAPDRKRRCTANALHNRCYMGTAAG